MSKKVGIIAEDKSDVAAIKILIHRLGATPISVKQFVGNGCGKILGKADAWSKELARAGCSYLLVVHDLDQRNPADLLAALRRAISNSPISKSAIVIPTREIEAWLLSDEVAISKFFKLKKGLKRVSNPEGLSDPKEKIGQLVYQSSAGAKRYVSTIHNEKLFEQVSVARLKTCRSFLVLEKFIRESLS